MEYYEAIIIWISFIYPDLGHFPWYIFKSEKQIIERFWVLLFFLKKEKGEEMFLFVGA